MNSVERAIERAFNEERRCRAMESGTWPIAAHLKAQDAPDAHLRIKCELLSGASAEGGMMRFSLTDEALMALLPDEAGLLAYERRRAAVVDALFAGLFPLAAQWEAAALALAKTDIALRCGGPPMEPELTGPSRTLLWLSAKAIDNDFAAKQLVRALSGISPGKGRRNGALRYCRAALVCVLDRLLVLPKEKA